MILHFSLQNHHCPELLTVFHKPCFQATWYLPKTTLLQSPGTRVGSIEPDGAINGWKSKERIIIGVPITAVAVATTTTGDNNATPTKIAVDRTKRGIDTI